MRSKKKAKLPPPGKPNCFSSSRLLDIIKGRAKDPFVEIEGKVYIRFDRMYATGSNAVFSHDGQETITVPLDYPMGGEGLYLIADGLLEVKTT